jgi:hypothetical protein
MFFKKYIFLFAALSGAGQMYAARPLNTKTAIISEFYSMIAQSEKPDPDKSFFAFKYLTNSIKYISRNANNQAFKLLTLDETSFSSDHEKNDKIMTLCLRRDPYTAYTREECLELARKLSEFAMSFQEAQAAYLLPK